MITKKEMAVSESDLLGFNNPADKLQLRILNNVAGSSVLSVILIEVEDSFLVAAPSRLVSYQDDLKIESYVPVPYARFFKSTILSVTPLFKEFEYHYIKYLLESHDTLFEGIFTAPHIDYLKFRLNEVTNKGPSETTTKTIKDDVPSADSFMILTDSKYKH